MTLMCSDAKTASGEVGAAHAQLDEEEDVQCLQKQRVHGEEVTGDDLLFVMGHQLPPTERRTTSG